MKFDVFRHKESGEYFIQFTPFNEQGCFVHSLKDNRDIFKVRADFEQLENIKDVDYTQFTTENLVKELESREDSPFDYRTHDIVNEYYIVGYKNVDNDFILIKYAYNLRVALETASTVPNGIVRKVQEIQIYSRNEEEK